MGLSRFSNLITRRRFGFFVGLVLCAVFTGVFSSTAYAEYVRTGGLFTDANDVRWEYERTYDTSDGGEIVIIKFFDKPSTATTIVVPSLAEVLANVPNASPTLNTYFLDSADVEYQAQHFSETKRESTADVNKLDMSNTAKIQIRGVEPIINPDVETELVFGEEMVISDMMNVGRASIGMCTEFYHERVGYVCTHIETIIIPYSSLPFWELLSPSEKTAYNLSFSDYVDLFLSGVEPRKVSRYTGNYSSYAYYLPNEEEPDLTTTTYYTEYSSNWSKKCDSSHYYFNECTNRSGVFSKYKLKLTNFGDFNYLGWYAFEDAIFSEDSREITVREGYNGSYIFAYSNAKKAIITTAESGDGLFLNCSELTEAVFDDSVNTVVAETFKGTNLGELDISNTNIKILKYCAFEDAHLSSVNLEGIEDIGAFAFRNNLDLTEVYLPKSINRLGHGIFDSSYNIKKVTVAYDTLTSGTTEYFSQAFGSGNSDHIEELTVLAPYEQDEPLKLTHVLYDDYKYHFDMNGNWTDERNERDGGNNYGSSIQSGYPRNDSQQSEIDYAHVDTYKNVIAPNYFELLNGLKKITIGEGYEFIGVKAFFTTDNVGHLAWQGFGLGAWAEFMETGNASTFEYGNYRTRQIDLSLPDSLKGIGNLSLINLGGSNLNVNLPSGLEYIGIAAFRGSMGLKGDIDLPNLIFLGDEAFKNTQVSDVVIHDKLQYYGGEVFAGCPFIRNVTIDYDMFNPAKNAYYDNTRPLHAGSFYYESFAVHFGLYNRWHNMSEEEIAAIGINVGKSVSGGFISAKYGTIKFTDKVVTEYPEWLYTPDEDYPTQYRVGNFFSYLIADKIDLSECGWKILPRQFFLSAQVDEVLLPSGLEIIDKNVFNNAEIKEELVLPDTVKEIRMNAFSQGATGDNRIPFVITKLPNSLEKVGNYAFFGDSNLAMDFDLANLKEIGKGAFMRTGLRDIVLNSKLEKIGEIAFSDISTLRNITVDVDLAGIDMPQDSYNFAALFNQADYQTTDFKLVVDNIVFTDRAQTLPSVGDVSIKTWPECEYGYYSVTLSSRSCWYHSDHTLNPHEFDDWANEMYWQNDNGVWYREYYKINPIISTGKSSYFYGVTAKKIDLGNTGWTSMPTNVFNGVKADEVLLPGSITTIPYAAFYQAEIGGELKIPDSVTHLDGAFRNAKFNRIILPSGLQTADYNSVFWNTEVSDAIVVPEGVTNLPNSMFMNVKAKSVELPNTLETIGYNVFMFAKLEDELVLPESLKVIKDHAFYDADYLHSKWQGDPDGDWSKASDVIITKLPASLEKIGSNAFHGYRYELDVDLPNLKEIGGSAFMQANVKSVKLYDKIESIGSGAFLYNPNLRNIYLDCDFFGLHGGFYPIFSTVNPPLPESYSPYWFGNQDQSADGSSFDSIVFTDKNITLPTQAAFAYFDIKKLDITNAKWTKIPDYALFKTTVNEPVTVPDTVVEIAKGSFQESNITLTDTFSEGLRTIGEAAFYGASVSGDLVIPSTVESIGWSAFNAGDTDTNYSTVTIKPALDYDKSNNQAVFQMFWNAKMDKLVIESIMLPVLGTLQAEPVMPHEGQIWGLRENGTYGYITATPTLRADGEPEFHGMTMREVEIKNLPAITDNAFEECAQLEAVSFAEHDNLQEIGKYAFNNDNKLKKFVFGEELAGKNIALKTYAFNNTAIETIGDNNTDFALTAAIFNAVEPHVFSNMPKLVSVSIPSIFSIDVSLANEELNTNGSTIPSYTFADDPELATVEVGYELSTIREDAFANDNKLAKIFLWGNTDIEENGADLTIPEPTTIFAYSDAPAESYANDESRNDYDGKFYALDEVLYLTSNKSKVLLNEDKTDFDKTGLKLYGLRRDGVILESDWQNYNTAFKRTETPEGTNISFEEGRGALGPDDTTIAATVFDAPKPFNTISLANENFANVDYEFVAIASNNNPLIVVHYPDGYTGNIRNTTLVSTTVQEIIEDITDPEPEEELEVPDTGSFGALIGAATSSVSIATIIVLGGIFIAKRRKN